MKYDLLAISIRNSWEKIPQNCVSLVIDLLLGLGNRFGSARQRNGGQQVDSIQLQHLARLVNYCSSEMVAGAVHVMLEILYVLAILQMKR